MVLSKRRPLNWVGGMARAVGEGPHTPRCLGKTHIVQMYLACTVTDVLPDSSICRRRASHSLVISSVMVLSKGMHMLSSVHYGSHLFLEYGTWYDTLGSYSWCLLGKVFDPIYIPCDLTQMCGYMADYSTLDTLERWRFHYLSILRCIPRMWR